MKQINIWCTGNRFFVYEGLEDSVNRYDPAKRAEIQDLEKLKAYLVGFSRTLTKKKVKVGIDSSYSGREDLEQAVQRIFDKADIIPIDFNSPMVRFPKR